eukprot:s1070_g1.t1
MVSWSSSWSPGVVVVLVVAGALLAVAWSPSTDVVRGVVCWYPVADANQFSGMVHVPGISIPSRPVSLLTALGLAAHELTITEVVEGTYRRLGRIQAHQRRLATAWTVQYQVVTALTRANTLSEAVADIGQDLASFQAILASALSAAGVDESSLILNSFGAVSMQVQARSDDSQIEDPDTSDPNVTVDSSNATAARKHRICLLIHPNA